MAFFWSLIKKSPFCNFNGWHMYHIRMIVDTSFLIIMYLYNYVWMLSFYNQGKINC